MVSAELNQNGDNIENISAEQSLSRDSSYACGVFGEPKLLPRVGDEYQAEIPALISGPKYDSYLNRLVDAAKKDHVPFDFWLGLSVPVTWTNNINKVNENIKDTQENFFTQSTKALSIFGSVRETVDPYRGSSYSLVPGVCSDSWNDIEEASFLLGLYIFKKKFVQLGRFIGSKKMGDVLLLYYSKFYRSIEYNRWSTCRKGSRRKCVSGQLLFSGLRQQELLSRLLSQVSEECQKAITEVTKTYAKKDMSLFEYVFSIKSMVGLETFVDAVAIGKGKQDLTSMAIGPVRIPTGKACSKLTFTEIVNFLTGGYRLSKAQSSDLLWEAVWPRLLARGWHSEQPKNQAYGPGANDSLVFLTPGVEKYSGNLVRGNHYYDSVTDVLNKVGSEPELLELHTGNDEGTKKEDDGWMEEIKEQQYLHKKRQCYLQPQTPICDMDDIIVVDTSLDNGFFFKSRELRTLPMDKSKMKFVPKDGDQGTSNASANISDFAHNMLVAQETNSTTDVKITLDRGKNFDSSSDQLIQINGPDSIKPLEKAKKQKKLHDDQQARKRVHIHLSQKLKRNDLDSLTSITKRYRTVAACVSEEIGSGRSTIPSVPEFGDHVNVCCSSILDPKNKAFTQVDFPGDVFVTDSTNMQDGIMSTQQDDLCAPKTSADISVQEQPANINSRRQGTRNRPPTARALEALVNGDLTAKRRKD